MRAHDHKINIVRKNIPLSVLAVFTALICMGILTNNVMSSYASSETVINHPESCYDSTNIQINPKQTITMTLKVSLPLVFNHWPPIPFTPTLNQIDNTDQNNLFTVTWSSAKLANTYVLEETTDPSFSNSKVVYQGSDLSWAVPAQGRTPASYFYRIKAINSWGDSSWSNIQSVTIYPLFVGLKLRWDGEGYIRGCEYYDVGYHRENNFDLLTEPDIIRSNNSTWYDPNPKGWAIDTWYTYHSVSTGQWKSSSVPDDPSWKWSHPWILSYPSQFSNGQKVSIDGQAFTVTGPHAGYTAFGEAVQYWQFVNNDKFLIWDGGGDWKQYCHKDDVILRYDAGNTKLLLYSNIMRRYYYKGNLNSNTVQYIHNLTYANSFPDGSTNMTFSEIPIFVTPQSSSIENAWNNTEKQQGIR